MLLRLFSLTIALVASPCLAQFGLGPKRRDAAAGTNFEDLQEQAKRRAAGKDALGALGDLGLGDLGLGDLGELEDMIKELYDDPKAMEELAKLGEQGMEDLNKIMEQLNSMSPEAMAEEMQKAVKMLEDGSLIDNMMENKEEMLKQMEQAGLIPPEEMAKLKSDPEYFEKAIKESFSKMGEIVSNPEYIKQTTEAIEAMKSIGKDENGEDISALLADLLTGSASEETIEATRQKLLKSNLANDPMMAAIPGLKEMINDPVKFREEFKAGLGGGRDEL